MHIPQRRQGQGLSINMTPMIDVTFLLIIFFLVSSHLAKQEKNMPLDLPLSRTGLPEGLDRQRATTTVQVLADGAYLLAGNPVTLPVLQRAIAARHAETPGGLRLRIRTDQAVPYANIAGLLKACTQAGIVDVVFAVREDQRVKSGGSGDQ
jgi:biopolymer transport protein ExbD